MDDPVASELIDILGTGRQVRPFSERIEGFGMARAYAIVERVRGLREGRGERPVGRKIGFTNRAIWDAHGIDAPIWNYVWDHTVRDADASPFVLGLLPEPRIEPEVVLHLSRAPEPGMDPAALIRCIDWIAPGLEIVYSIFPGWKLTAADATAAYGVHGGLVIGERLPVSSDPAGWLERLSTFTVTLDSGSGIVRHGAGKDVLGSPLAALRFLVDEIARHDAPVLAADETVTTGTLTEAMSVMPGETWTMTCDGIGFAPLSLRLV